MFEVPTTSSLGSPIANGGIDEIDRFSRAAGMSILHELVHLASHRGEKLGYPPYERRNRIKFSHIEIIDQGAAYPPEVVSWTNRN